ncbi:MAG: bacteriohopanetetrol glucosamine biosynthesis glycosyltransferase HpnI [Rhodospirillales bacterium]|nr:bacteriohopanetetrol glucosamine biosynthesis glycosyltransferase HpnI [Rhodospirillales bacterium]
MIAALLAALLAGVGAAQALAGWIAVARFAAKPRRLPAHRPPITVLKPLHGDEPRLDAALETLCRQDYPAFQIVFGVQDAADPAIGVVRRLQSRHPGLRIALVVDPTPHGANRKVANLINMLPAARHAVLAIADSDLHVAPDWLTRLAAALETPNAGLVTTLYAGLPVAGTWVQRLGATQITGAFLPGALLARALGRRDCLGATMLLRRATLDRIGGLAALADHLADDNVLGQLVRAQGMEVVLADTVPLTTVPEARLGALWRHELRWARTIRALAPGAFAASALQYGIVWALAAVVLSGAAAWAWAVLAGAIVARAAAGRGIERALRGMGVPLAFPCPFWLLPARELIAFALVLAAFAGNRVEWRGHRLTADRPQIQAPIQDHHAR